MAFAGRATTFAELAGTDVEHVALKPRAEHYAPGSRAALHHLERGLFELDEAQLFDPDPVDPGAAVTLLQGGGERAELELVAAEAARLIGEEGVAPEEIAVVLRTPGDHAALLTEIFGAFGVRLALERQVAFGHTPLGRGLVGLARCALPDGAAEDLIAYLRTPGLLQRAELADRLETRARQEGARTAAAVRAPVGGGALDARRDRSRARRAGARRRRRSPSAWRPSCSPCSPRRAGAPRTSSAAPRRRTSRCCAPGAGRSTSSRRSRAPTARWPPSPTSSRRSCTTSTSSSAPGPGPGLVTVAEPLSLRARRVRILFACGLQEGIFPAAPRTEPFFADTEREQIAAASGLRLRRRDELGAERYLFYATVSRPEERLYLSWHEAGDDGQQAVRSFFVSDVCDLFGPELQERRRTRTLGQVGWPAGRRRASASACAARPSRGPRRREAQIAALRDARLVAQMRDRPAWSASAIELWASCPVRWFVERMLKPEG